MADLITRSTLVDEELIKDMMCPPKDGFDEAMKEYVVNADGGSYYFIEGSSDSKVLLSVPYPDYDKDKELLLEFSDTTIKSNRLSIIPLYTAMFLQGYGLDVDIIATSVPVSIDDEYNVIIDLGGKGVQCKHTPELCIGDELDASGFESEIELGIGDVLLNNMPPTVSIGLGISGQWLRYLEWLVQVNRVAHFIKWNESIDWSTAAEPIQYIDGATYECQDCYYHVNGDKINSNGGHCPYCGSDTFINAEAN